MPEPTITHRAQTPATPEPQPAANANTTPDTAKPPATTSAEPQDVIRQAHADVTSGLQDTDRGPVTDAVYEHQIRPDGGSGETRDRAAPSPASDE